MLPEARVTREESSYRAKFFTGITSVAHKDFFCTSCGNTITSEADSYYSHPFLGTLQCQTCYDKFRHLKTSLDVEAWKKSCLMCGSNSCQTLFPCPVKNCPYSFCRNCIKRNAQSALILADTKKWKCFVCMTNPLWEARGVCATLISASTRRMKKKQYGRNVSSDDDDIDDIVARIKSQKSLKQSKPLRQKNSKIPSARETRSRSRASVNEEDSDDDIQIISTHERRTSKTSAVRTRRKISSQESLNEESEVSDSSVRKNKIFNTQPIKKKTGDSSTKNTSQKSLTVKRANSDSSSGKEFTQTKLIKESFVPLQRLPLGDSNTVNERDEIDKTQKILSQQEASSLKDQMDDFIDMLKSTSERLAKAAESLQEQCPKEQKVKYREATKLLMHCKSTFSSFKRKMKKNERKMVSNFGNWCKKSNVKNIFPVIDITADSGADDSSAGSDCDDDEEIVQCHTEKSVKNTEEQTTKGALSPVHEEPSSSDGGDVKSALPKNSHNSSNSIKKNEEKNNTKRKEKNPNESLNDIFEEELDVEENQIAAAEQETGHLSDSRPRFIEKQKATKKNSVRDKSPDHLQLSGDESDTTIKRRSQDTRSSESSIEFDFSRKKGLKRSRISDSSREDIEDQSGDDHQPNERKNETCKQSKKKIRKESHSKIERAKKSEEEARKMLLDSSSDTENHSDQSIVGDTELPTKEMDKKLIGCSKQAKKDQVADETSIRNAEEEAKKKLMNSDSSSTEDESNDPLGESQKGPSSNVAEEEAKQKLLNSSSSSNNEESSPVIDKLEKNATRENSKESNEDKTGESTDEIINKERLAKKKLLDSSSSEDENLKEKSKKPKSPSSLKSQAEVKRQQLESNKPKTAAGIGSEAVCSPGSFDAEKKAREMLLNSESSSEEECVINKTDESINPLTEAKKDGPAVTDPDEQAKQKLLNSSSSSAEDVETTPAVPNEAANNSDVKSTKKTRVTESQEENSGPEKENRITEAEKPCTEEESDVRKNINEKNLPSSKRERPIFLKKNRFYKADKKLRIPCWVTLARLPNTILRRHAKALKKSRDYLEDKSLNSLTCIDNLEKNRKRGHSEDHSESSTVPSKSRNRKKTAKEPEEVLADHLNVNGDGQMEVDDDTSDSEACNTGLQEAQGLDKDNEEFAKRGLLDSSDDEKLEAVAESSGDDVENKTKKKKKKTKAESESDDEAEGKKSKSKQDDWRKDKLLRMKLSSSDEEENAGKFEKKVEKLSQNSKNSDDSDVEMGKKKDQMKKRTRRRRLNSDSDVKLTDVDSSDSNASDSDKGEPKKSDKKTNKRRAKAVDDSSDSSSTVKSRAKPKRRRVRTAGTDSDSDEEMNNSQSSPNKPGRKNIRKVLKDKQVADDTKHAAKQEEERLKRMAERQKLYNEMYEARLAGEEKVDKLILDFDEETKEELLSVNEALVKRLKPHQAQGIKFMWDACFESLERATTTKGSGCILAHCMGLGKSFQVVTLTHTLLTNEKTGVKTVLVVCPLSTVLNWVNEFKIWLSEVEDGDDIEVYEMTKMKKNFERKYQLERWQKTGGVLIIGYEMYRNLSNPTKKLSKKIKESFFKCLVEPGPDLVVCDEGHLLKSESTAISKAMSKIRTLRRIVLTGTPLQNNLTEYHCMVQFVKPNLLGTKKEFLNRFVNPIQNGQFDDSTEYDVKIMKKRAHVLHKMLEGSVQRFDYSVLTPFLPPKQEYVIFLKLSDVQVKLYQYYIDNLARRHRAAGGSLFADFQALQRVWTHPLCIKLNADKVAERKLHEASDSEGSLRDFIDDDSDSDSSSKSDSSVVSTGSSKKSESAPKKRNTRANPNVNEEVVEEPAPGNTDWWAQFIEEDHYEDLRISAKLTILFDILKEAEQIGDKVLVFSQSLYSLTLIERFLALIDDETQKGITSDFIDGHTGSWSLGLDYFRLDGQSSTENRSQWCKIFNRPTNTRARLFLISTRAGGLGINLTAANRVVIFDASWNPSHDVQSIFRIYRFGQKKPCYVYRLLAAGTMEEKIYNRQVTKLSLSCRVVDEQQIERHYTNSDLAELYKFDKPDEESSKTIGCPKDRLLAEIFSRHKDLICNFHEHDSLLENKADEELDEEERKQAWLEYEQEKAGKPAYTYNPVQMMNMEPGQMMPNYQQMMNPFANGALMQSQLVDLQRLYQKDYPNLTPEQQKIMATKALMDMYSYMENRTIMDNRTILGNRLMMGKPQTNYGNPTNTLANQLAQEAYTKHHQQQKQMTAYQKQLAYAQQHGNFKTLAAGPVRGPQPNLIQQRPTASNDPDIIEITPTPATVTSNNAVAAQSSKAQPKPTNNQEE